MRHRGGATVLAAALAAVVATGCERTTAPAGPGRVLLLAPDDPSPPGEVVAAFRDGVGAAAPAADAALAWREVRGPATALAARIDGAGGENGELVLAVSAPALAAAMAAGRPAVFTGVADPMAAGAREAGRLARWLPWLFAPPRPAVTGVTAAPDFTRLFALARPLLSGHRLGAVTAAADTDSRALAVQAEAAILGAGGDLVAESARTTADAAAAVQGLCEARVAAIIALGDRTTDAALEAIAGRARDCGIALLGTRRPHADAGAVLTLARDERGAARQAGRRAARMLREPHRLPPPFARRTAARLVLNAGAADRLGIGFPLSLVAEADEVLDDEAR